MAIITPEYQEELVKQHRESRTWGGSVGKYGSGDILGLITNRGYIETVLDYGCGKGELAKYLHDNAPHVDVTSYDPGIPGRDTPPTGRFDLVITCDVLEHVEYEYIAHTIIKLADLTQYVMYNNIACAPDRHTFKTGPYVGQDRHLIQRPPENWRERFTDVITDPKISLMEYRSIQRRHKSGWRGRCVMIHERVG